MSSFRPKLCLHCSALNGVFPCCAVLNCSVLSYTKFFCSQLYYAIRFCSEPHKFAILSCISPHGTLLPCIILYCSVLYSTSLYRTILYCTVLLCTALSCSALYCTVHYCFGAVIRSISNFTNCTRKELHRAVCYCIEKKIALFDILSWC